MSSSLAVCFVGEIPSQTQRNVLDYLQAQGELNIFLAVNAPSANTTIPLCVFVNNLNEFFRAKGRWPKALVMIIVFKNHENNLWNMVKNLIGTVEVKNKEIITID